MRRARVLATLGGVALLTSLVVGPTAASTTVTPNGTWEAYPGSSTTYQTSVQQPINTDGSSNFKATGKGVIPVKFGLSTGTGPFVFESIGSDTATDNDYSFVSFTPIVATTFSQITELSSAYQFTLGDCHGGSLRWQVRTSATEALFIYYGTPPEFGANGVGGCAASSGAGQTGSNLIGLDDLRYDTSQYTGGTFYDTYAHALLLLGNAPIVRASLVLDSGWGGDQRLTLTKATFATAGFTETFTPPSTSGGASPTCNIPTGVLVKIVKTSGLSSGAVNEPITIQPNDNDGTFRVVDCKLMYNLATSSLTGAGQYEVSAVVDGVTATGPAVFELR